MQLIRTETRVTTLPMGPRWPQVVGGCNQETIERATEEFRARARRARFQLVQGGR